MYNFVRQILLLLMSGSLLIGCTNSESSVENRQLNALLQTNDSLINQIKLKNQELDEVTSNMQEIENNLSAIRRNEIAIDSLRKVGGVRQEEKINQLIKEIDQYVEDNRKKVTVLERQMKNSKNESMGLALLVDQQKRTVIEKEQQIQYLNSTITNLRQELLYTINTKNAEISDKQRVIEEKETEMNTVFFTFGTRDKLMNDGIIRKEGGVLGAGKAFVLANKFDSKQFKQANMRDVNQIDVGVVDKKTVITSHPAESYYFVKSGGRTILKIVDYQKFWSISKYLVIETEGGA
jgi:hypothetical protein